MKLRATLLAIVVLSAVLVATGCSGGGAQGGTTGGGEGPRIGLSVSTLNNPFFVSLRDGAQQAADETGAKLIVANASNDSSQQLNDIQNLVSQQVDALLVNPVDTDAVVPAIQAANQADIPVIALDRSASGGKIVTTIASNNVKGGKTAANKLIELVESGPIAQLQGTPGTSAARERGKGFQQVIEGQSAVNLVASQPAGFSRSEGLNVTQNILEANPNVKGIFAQNDEMALGAVQALGDRAGDEVKIVGFDGTDDALQAIQDGRMNATVAQQPGRLGRMGVQTATDVLNGKEVPDTIPVEVKLVTQENVSQYLEGGGETTGG